MNTKHTPGPWTICPSTHSGLGISNARDGALPSARPAIGIVGRERREVGEGWHFIAAMNDHSEADADARLLAAAPELLEALRTIVANSASVQMDPQWAVDVARAAIAKATGGAL